MGSDRVGEFGERRGDPYNGRSVESELLVAAAKDELRRHFWPEFFNRVGDIVLLKPLTLPGIEKWSTCWWPTCAGGWPTGG